MLRVLIAFNAILALFLAIRVATTGTPALAAGGGPSVWRASDLRVVGVPPNNLTTILDSGPAGSAGGSVLSPVPREFLLHLGAEVAPLPLPTSPVDLGLAAEPPLELTAVWHTSSMLKVRAMRAPLPATNYRLRVTRELRALDGRVLAAGATVAMPTPNVGLREVTVEDDPQAAPGRGAVRLRVQLDLPVDPVQAQRFLGLRHGAYGEPLAVLVESVAGGDDCLFRIGLLQGELPPSVAVVLDKGIVPKRGSVPLSRTQTMPVDVYEPLELRSLAVEPDGLRLSFNRSIPEPAPEFVKWSNAGPPKVETSVRGLLLRGECQPGTLVTLDLAAGFPGRGRSSLAVAVHRTVLVPDLPPTLGLVGDGEVLSARAEPVLWLRGCNVDKVWLRLRKVYANNVVRMLQDRDLRVFEPAAEHAVSIVASRNVEWRERVDLRQLLGGEPRGFYQVEFWHADHRWPDSHLLQITDLGVTVRAGVDSAAVQVVSIAEGTACAGAEVTILTPTNQVLATGLTTAEGVLVLRWQGIAPDRQPYVVVVQHGDDRVYVGMQQFGVELADEGLGGRAYLRDRCEAMVWPSRGIVRPGERLDLLALVRDAGGAAAVDRDMQWVVTSPGGKEFRRLRSRTPASGLMHESLELPTDAPCGHWSVVARCGSDEQAIGQASFEVAAFVPNRLEATVEVVGRAELGAALLVRIQGHWLDGTAAAERPVQARVRLLHGKFAPSAWPGFSFESVRVGSDADNSPPGELPAVDGVLDAKGCAELRLQLPPSPDHQVLIALVMAEVLDPSGRPVRVQTQQVVLRPDFVLGLRAQGETVDLGAVAADGSVVAAGEAQLRIERRHWEWRYEQRDSRRWAWRSYVTQEVVFTTSLALLGGKASVALPASAQARRANGEWLVAVATLGDRRAEQVLGTAPRAPDRLRVRAANCPAPGELAWLEVEAPAAGRGFVTLESDSMHMAAVVALQAGHNRIAVPVPAGLRLPNLHAVVTLTRPIAMAKAGEGPAWLLGGADLRLQRDDLRATVQLTVPALLLPQQELHVKIAAPGASQAMVAIVDEGVLGITGHASPDPLAFCLASRKLGVAGADTGSRLVRDMEFAPRTKTGGDDDDVQGLLRGGSVDPHIRPLALFAEVPLTDGHGATVFRLPAYEGRVRVMVLAAGPQRTGGAAAEVVVKAPLGLQVVTPRMVAPGDRFVVPVTVRNDLDSDCVVVVEVEVPAALALAAGRRFELPVAVGRVATLEVPMVAQSPGEGTQPLMVTASCAGVVRTVAAHVTVRSVRLPTREHLGLRLGEAQQLQVASGWSPDRLRAEVRLDVAPDRQLRPALEAMLEYPYGCCEQTASRGMALASCAALLPRLFDGADQPPAVMPLVQAAVDRLMAMQTTRGGFGWWLRDGSDHAFLTVHAMNFLVQARELGAQLPERGFARGQERLVEFAAAADSVNVRCHAIEVLARLGRSVQPRLDWLCAQPVGGEARARLATALALLGERRRAVDLLRHGDEVDPTIDATCLDSPVREAALLVRARLAIDPGDPALPGLVASLQHHLLRPAALTTQETAQALRAVADYYRRQPAPASVPQATFLVDGVATVVLPGRPMPLPIRPGSTVRVEAGGAGFVLLQVSGFAPPVAHDDDRLSLHREIVDLETGLPTTQLRRGRVYEVRIHGVCATNVSDVVVVDVLPGGCEAEPAASEVTRREDDDVAAAPAPATEVPANLEARDDRVLLFCNALPAGPWLLRHRIRAVFPGDYEAPALQAQAMYDPSLFAVETNRLRVEIRP